MPTPKELPKGSSGSQQAVFARQSRPPMTDPTIGESERSWSLGQLAKQTEGGSRWDFMAYNPNRRAPHDAVPQPAGPQMVQMKNNISVLLMGAGVIYNKQLHKAD